MSGTDLAFCVTRLRACYGVSGTDPTADGIRLRSCYGMSGTDLEYGATRRVIHAANRVQSSYGASRCSHFKY
eukprot:2861743-Rhodomonas_salina.2